MSAEMDALVTAVQSHHAVDDSVLALLAGLAPQIADAAGDRAKSLALAAEVKAKADAMAAAVLANTPGAPVVP